MSLYLGSDHAGYPLKEKLKVYFDEKGIKYTDLGCFSEESVDYPDMAREVCEQVLEKPENKGILICGTGIGMSMVANKFSGIRAALCTDPMMAEYTRKHNDANVLCLGARVIDENAARGIAAAFLENEYEGGRHQPRLDKIQQLEKKFKFHR